MKKLRGEVNMEKELLKKLKINLMDENGKYNFLGYKISYLNIEDFVEKAWYSIMGYRCDSAFDNSIFRWDIFEKYFSLSIDSNVEFGSKIHNYQYMYLITPNDNRLSCIPTPAYKHYINTFHWSCGVSISGNSWFHGIKATPNKGEFVIAEDEYDNNGTIIIASDDWVTHWYLIQHMYLAYKNSIKENSEYDKQFLIEQLEKLLTYAEVIRNPQYTKGIRFCDCGSTHKVELCVGYHVMGYIEIPNYDDEDLATLLETRIASKGIEYDFKVIKEKLENFIKEKFKNKR